MVKIISYKKIFTLFEIFHLLDTLVKIIYVRIKNKICKDFQCTLLSLLKNILDKKTKTFSDDQIVINENILAYLSYRSDI